MTQSTKAEPERLDPRKFQKPWVTADGQKRGVVALTELQTLWFNTGTLCNLMCQNCYIESSPRNDRLSYLTRDEVAAYLDEITERQIPTKEIGFTGGEPFMNPQFIHILEESLSRGFQTLVLTNAMRPMMKCAVNLLDLQDRYGDQLILRISLDHYTRELFEIERGRNSWPPTIKGLTWLAQNGFKIRLAGRSCWGESEATARLGFAKFCAEHALPVDAQNPETVMIFPEMDEDLDVPEITEHCWDILGIAPQDIMCATSRMVVKRKGEDRPVVMPCTLLPYQDNFVMGHTLADAEAAVPLNHPHCSRFCVLGGGSCSRAG
ncbi:MAG: radical SAM protein [Pseudomonadota bacterium]